PLNQTWDYIIVGSGAAGIPLADRLSEAGASVLLLERGWASSGRWGGTWKPSWLQGTNLTRFDVPALAQLIWTTVVDNKGILCDDVQMTASCVLGGGTAINAGQFYLPTPDDFDINQPPGFRWADMTSAFQKAKDRLPWTEHPSLDGKSYLTNGTQIAIDALTNSSMPNPHRFIHANDELDDRNRVTSFAEYFFINGEKGGPMATYLVSASERKNFHLQLNTTVARVLRDGNKATGVEVEATSPGGLNGTIKVTPRTGRVILSAGVFNTFKILLRSGIGSADQLHLLSNHSTESAKLPPKEQWINLPVGHNLDDSPAIVLAVDVPHLEIYDWESLWNSTGNIPEIRAYLDNRTGPLAEIQPSLSPISWEKIRGEDGRTRVVQWDVNSNKGMGLVEGGLLLFTSNLCSGKTSRGRLSLVPSPSRLFVNVTTMPYFNDEGDHDFKAVLASATSLLDILKTIPDSSILLPSKDTPLQDYLRGFIASQALTRNHWAGSTRMGESCSDKEAVVDSTTAVCGMKNLHVVDAGIINGVPTANPQATFIVAAERAAEIILGL
ncbi:GMC oxidoreductase, partial [Cucurbitaria berberidis CBS 394.84]